jgi:hypothetical protein
MISCKKKKDDRTPDQIQIQQEQNEPLKTNELLEKEGLRFIVRSAVTDTAVIQIDLKLFKGSGPAKSTTPIMLSKDGEMNYSIESKLLENNTEYTLTIAFNKILQNKSYELLTEGFTSLSGSKELLITGKMFHTDSVGTSKDLMVIRKGILKFSVSEL